MGGGAPRETFKIVRYHSAIVEDTKRHMLTTEVQHVVVNEQDRIKIAAILGIHDPEEQKRLSVGSVYIHPAPPGAGPK